MKRMVSLFLAIMLLLLLCACGKQEVAQVQTEAPATTAVSETTTVVENGEVAITDMIGREVTIAPGSYKKVVCIGAGALRMYSYIGDVGLLAGVEDIDNTTLSERPMMFDSVARPYVLAYEETF